MPAEFDRSLFGVNPMLAEVDHGGGTRTYFGCIRQCFGRLGNFDQLWFDVGHNEVGLGQIRVCLDLRWGVVDHFLAGSCPECGRATGPAALLHSIAAAVVTLVAGPRRRYPSRPRVGHSRSTSSSPRRELGARAGVVRARRCAVLDRLLLDRGHVELEGVRASAPPVWLRSLRERLHIPVWAMARIAQVWGSEVRMA